MLTCVGLVDTSKLGVNSFPRYSIRMSASSCRYVRQVESFLSEGRVSNEVFATHCLPTLLILSCDRVSNVRLSVARVLKDTVLSIGACEEDGERGVWGLCNSLTLPPPPPPPLLPQITSRWQVAMFPSLQQSSRRWGCRFRRIRTGM